MPKRRKKRQDPTSAEISRNTGIPTKYIDTLIDPRQKRWLSKVGLMPLTSIVGISKKTGIPVDVLRRVDRGHPFYYSTKFEIIQRFKQDPSTQPLINHPKLWAIAQIQALAKNHSIREIHEKMLERAKKKNAALGKRNKKWAKTYKVPNPNKIHIIITTLDLRTRKDIAVVKVRQTTENRRRTPNRLTGEERIALIKEAFEFLKQQNFSPPNNNHARVPPEDLRDAVMDLLLDEVVYFSPHPYSNREKLVQGWLRYLKTRLKWFSGTALRKIGPVTAKGNPRRPIASTPSANRVEARTEAHPKQVIFRKPLSPREEQVFELTRNGLSRKQIANLLGIIPQSVSKHIGNIVKKTNNR